MSFSLSAANPVRMGKVLSLGNLWIFMIRPLRHSNWAKHKKLFAFVVLFFVLSGFILPNIAQAFSIDPNNWQCTDRTRSTSLKETAQNLFEDFFITGPFNCFNYYLAYVIAALGSLLVEVGRFYLQVDSAIFKFVANQLIEKNGTDWSITRGTGFAGKAILSSWNEVKDWANMVIVLGFIAVAMSFILSLEQYKKLLVPLLIVALLVNFSILFVGLMIDASNIVMMELTGNGGNLSDIQYSINYDWNKFLDKFQVNSLSSTLAAFALSAIFAGIYVLIGTTLYILAMIFIIRYVVLVILFILSPLAFVFRVIPIEPAKKIWNSWWQHFLKWCFIGISGAFFLGLAGQILDVLDHMPSKPLTPIGPTGIQDPNQIASSMTSVVFYLAIVVIFLLAGIWLTLKSNPLVSVVLAAVAAIVGAIITGGASLMGGALKIGGKVTGTSGRLTNTANRVRDRFGDLYHGAREGLGLAGAGTLNTVRQNRMQERLKEPTERLKNTDNATLVRTAVHGATPAERAAAVNILKERDSLGEIGGQRRAQRAGESDAAYGIYNRQYDDRVRNERREAMRNAMAHDNKLRPTDFAKSDYRYKEFDESSTQQTMERIRTQRVRARLAPLSEESLRLTAAEQNRREQLETNLPTMSGNQRRNIDLEDLTPELLTSTSITPNIIRNFQTADDAHIVRIRRNAVINELNRRFRAATGNDREQNRLRTLHREIIDLPH